LFTLWFYCVTITPRQGPRLSHSQLLSYILDLPLTEEALNPQWMDGWMDSYEWTEVMNEYITDGWEGDEPPHFEF
jgi:hypothetical protein